MTGISVKDFTLYYQNLEQLRLLEKKHPLKALKKACAEFESLIWHEILKEFDRAMIKSDLIPETLEMKFYKDYLYQEIAEKISGKPGSLGDYLYKTLLKTTYFKNFEKKADKIK
ncbi:MAG: hypothetical protein GXO57_00295 [Thermodesulfobacteria bacterium]|nr:hypothetical protein [Thermodesulfobacteriota bacterium]